LTLVEVMMASCLVAILLVAALNVVGGVSRTYAVTDEKAKASLLAADLMNEILRAPYEDPNGSPVFGLETGEGSTSRSAFDDVDDYHNWSETPPAARNGTAYTGLTGWSRAVQVAWAEVLDPMTTAATESGLKRVQVTVTSPRGVTLTLKALHTRSGHLEWRPPDDRVYITGVDAQIRIDTRVTGHPVSTPLDNHVEGP
jgi:Tfp pilus assembly protein PilV